MFYWRLLQARPYWGEEASRSIWNQSTESSLNGHCKVEFRCFGLSAKVMFLFISEYYWLYFCISVLVFSSILYFCVVRIFMYLFYFNSIKCPLRSLQMATAEMDSFSPASFQESIKTSHINSAEFWWTVCFALLFRNHTYTSVFPSITMKLTVHGREGR